MRGGRRGDLLVDVPVCGLPNVGTPAAIGMVAMWWQ